MSEHYNPRCYDCRRREGKEPATDVGPSNRCYPCALARLATLRALVDQQAEDDGLWFIAETAPEAYLQQELRKLHAAVEGEQLP